MYSAAFLFPFWGWGCTKPLISNPVVPLAHAEQRKWDGDNDVLGRAGVGTGVSSILSSWRKIQETR